MNRVNYIILAITCCITGCSIANKQSFISSNISNKNLLFNDWSPDENIDITEMKKSETFNSNDNKFSIACRYHDDNFLLFGKTYINHHNELLAKGIRGIKIRWYSTKLGNVAIISYEYDTHKNKLLVLYPKIINNSTSWIVLFETPKCMYTTDKLILDHCYWNVEKLNLDKGVLCISCIWDFSNINNTHLQKQNYIIPLFYGRRVEYGVTH